MPPQEIIAGPFPVGELSANFQSSLSGKGYGKGWITATEVLRRNGLSGSISMWLQVTIQ